MRRLVVVKEVFDSGVSRSALDSRTARVLAVIDFDFAVETLLRLAYKTLSGKSPDRNEPFMRIANVVNDALSGTTGTGLAEMSEIDRMHAIRNGVQHHAEYPTADQTTRLRSSAGLCIDRTTRTIWGIGLGDIDEMESIGTEAARTRLEAAKAAMNVEAPDLNRALGQCWWAVTTVFDAVRAKYIGSMPHWGAEIITSLPFNEVGPNPGLLASIVRTQDLVLVQALGIDPVEYGKFLALTEGFMMQMGRDAPIRTMGPNTPEPTIDSVRFVYTFAVESIIKIESHLGALEGID